MSNEEKILALLEKQGEMIGQINGRLDRLETGQTAMQSDIADLKATQAQQGEQLTRMEGRLDELDARSLKSAVLLETDIPRDINRLYEAREEIARKLDTLATKEQVQELSGDVDVIKAVVSRHSGDISKLKKAQ